MAIAPLQLPTYATPQSLDFSQIGQLGQVYGQAKDAATEKMTLANLARGPDGKIDTAPLINSGNLKLSQLGIQIENNQQDRDRQAKQDLFQREQAAQTQKNADRSFGLQQSQFAENQDYTPQERAKMATEQGIQSGTPEFRAYVLTGKLPESNTTVASQTEQRRAAAAANGLTPDNPAYNSYVLTGKMPREDAQPLTATDKKAILEADDHVMTAKSAIDSLNKAKALSPKAMGFKGAGGIASVGAVFGNQASQDTVELDNVVTSNALTQLKSIFGGNPTEGERKIMLDIQGSSGLPDAVRQKIYDRAIGMAENRLKFNEQRATEMRGGSFYKKPGATAQSQSSNGAITQEQYNALPSGATFTAPDGTQRTKP